MAAAAAAAPRELLGASNSAVEAVAVTGATYSAVLLDRKGAVVRPCITLRDGRAGLQAQRINRELGGELVVGLGESADDQ